MWKMVWAIARQFNYNTSGEVITSQQAAAMCFKHKSTV
jgi:hypothetical protein